MTFMQYIMGQTATVSYLALTAVAEKSVAIYLQCNHDF